jgi:hypothetical protein
VPVAVIAGAGGVVTTARTYVRGPAPVNGAEHFVQGRVRARSAARIGRTRGVGPAVQHVLDHRGDARGLGAAGTLQLTLLRRTHHGRDGSAGIRPFELDGSEEVFVHE